MPAAKRPDEPIWMREAASARSSKPRALTRAKIVAAAIEVADREGLGAVSIRRVAAELEARPMSLYDHFASKDDLIDLMIDAAAERFLLDDDAIPADWRDGLRAIAHHTRDAVLRHPWLAETLGRNHRVGPASLKHMDQTVAAARGLEVDDATRQTLILAVDTYTLGHVIAQVSGELPGGRDERLRAATADYVQSQIDAGHLPNLADMNLGGLLDHVDPDASFAQGLEWLLAGAAAALGK